ncbi:MAG: CDP-alcohol phosphatidyltransferase family protein [Methanomicrobiales archaeon]|nr:CDP-alcohol phosphatidyltransferase family protein [Methanomicrobiales archaeon]NYT20914.1 CDP-alcohol phosphatidyltransferase family protein [Methanomicrobiales archaeon]
MNITALRPRLLKYVEPIATVFCRAGITPNQISFLSLLFGLLCAVCYFYRMFVVGSIFLFLSAVLDLVDGSVARRTEKETRFGAVFDWIVDKYVDALVILGIGLSGIAILSRFSDLPAASDFAIVAIAIIGSLMNTFIKPVVYAETGYEERIDGKIEDPLEGVGFFGRPETILVLIVGGLTGFIWVAVLLIAIGTNLSALQRIIYLYKRLS